MNAHPALFIADAPGLDFLNSIATPVDVPVEWIADGKGLLRWLEQAGLIPVDVLREVEERALPGELDNVAAQARTLREWFRGFVDAHRGRPLAPGDLAALDPLNRLLERDASFKQVVLSGAGMPELRTERRWNAPEALLLPIGEVLARLVCEEDFTQVKTCHGHGCTLLFADHTRGRARKWCSMAVCGNRSKQAALRERTKAGREPS